jgi:hypothetical protein
MRLVMIDASYPAERIAPRYPSVRNAKNWNKARAEGKYYYYTKKKEEKRKHAQRSSCRGTAGSSNRFPPTVEKFDANSDELLFA